MFAENKTVYIKKEVLSRIARLYFEERLVEEIDKLPIQMIKKNDPPFRCCIYKDREIIKYRSIVSLGFTLENEFEIDTMLLSDYAKLAIQREKPTFPILTFIDEACKACVRTNYFVTNVCKNCVGKPCIMNCPKEAISTINNSANINPEKCVNCGICMKVCPFHAIVYVPVPCEESCPVNAIIKDEKGKENIDYSKCIFCGKCVRACPFGAVMEKSQIIDVIKSIKAGKDVVAMIAPSIVGQFDASIKKITGALKLLGFKHIVEVAIGADITAEIESKEFIERMQRGDKLMGTSCCPAYTESVKKHAKDFVQFVSHAKTPMAYIAELVKKEYPDSVRVFIGPCIAKKHEGLFNQDIDYVLTFEELDALFIAKNVDVKNCEESSLDIKEATRIGREFPVSTGVASALKEMLKEKDIEIKEVFINGLTKQNVRLLNSYGKGNCPGNLVEVMSCEGGCIAGPAVISNFNIAKKRLEDFLNKG